MGSCNFDAVIFDLDGVITKTAKVHAMAWKEMFDEYLHKREKDHGEKFKEFTHANDYLPYVDGKPRYKGVESFLESRGINIPYGDPSDGVDKETICGLGNRKNQAFNEILQRDGVEVYTSTLKLMEDLRKAGIKMGVATSSKNCKQVLDRANLTHYFQTQVDGEVSAQLGLHGKPEPDIFIVAANNLGVERIRTVVVEDAVSGVQAASKGNFGFVLGVARENNAKELRTNGADIVVTDLKEINGIEGIDRWFKDGLLRDLWSASFHCFDFSLEHSRESMLTIGNGYFSTIGSLEEYEVDPLSRPSTCIAKLYSDLYSPFDNRKQQIDDFVDVPNWLPLSFKVGEGEWFDPMKDKVICLERNLNLLSGVLHKKMIVQDNNGNKTLIESFRFASMANIHHAAIDYSLTPLNYSGAIRIRSAIAMPKPINVSKPAQSVAHAYSQGGKNNISHVAAKTDGIDIKVAVAAQLGVFYEDRPMATDYSIKQDDGWVNTYIKANVNKDKMYRLEKLVSICNAQTEKIDDPLDFVLKDVAQLKSYGVMHAASIDAWEKIWKKHDKIFLNDRQGQKDIRLKIYHSIINNPNSFK